jgi:Bacterial SH3 domain
VPRVYETLKVTGLSAIAAPRDGTAGACPFPKRLLLVLVPLLGLCSGALQAEADGPDYYAVRGVARGDVLNMRAEPSPHAPKVGEIPPNGTCIRNLGCKGGLTFEEFTTLAPEEKERRARENPRWCKVEYQGVTGWVAGRYLTEGDCRR